jgi:hypothetical protein
MVKSEDLRSFLHNGGSLIIRARRLDSASRHARNSDAEDVDWLDDKGRVRLRGVERHVVLTTFVLDKKTTSRGSMAIGHKMADSERLHDPRQPPCHL